MTNPWIRIIETPPPQNQVVETKVDDLEGLRNLQNLKLVDKLWFLADGSMYVYYTPTHWRLNP
jgi:hypothetical protein